MCTKRKFPDKIAAEFAIIKLRSMKGRHIKGKFETTAYPCTMGGTKHWHLTSQRHDEKRKTN